MPGESNVVLIGFMGSGKSSVGRHIARRLRYRFIDTDRLVVEMAGMSIQRLFEEQGERGFRIIESRALRALTSRTQTVIATGGGIVTLKQNHRLLKKAGFIVWLTASEEVLFERVARNRRRPLLQTPDPQGTVRELLEKRAPLYEACADFSVDCSSIDHDAVADLIISELHRRNLCQLKE